MNVVILAAAEEAQAIALPLPTWGYPLIAAAVFALLGFIVFSFRDVSHRHGVPVNAAHEEHEGPQA